MTELIALRGVGAVVTLRELTGADERTVADTSTATAVALLDRLLGPDLDAGGLPATDRDRLLATAHRQAFSDRIEATIACRSCGELFDLDFRLSALQASLDDEAAERTPGAAEAVTPADMAVTRHDDGSYDSPVHGRFRLPTAHDELGVAHLPARQAAEALLQRALLEPAPGYQPDAFQALIGRIAPVIDRELPSRCPECGAEQPVHFDVQSYFLASLLAERPQLMVDVHRLASAYRWSRRAILRIPRRERRSLVALVDAVAARPARSSL